MRQDAWGFIVKVAGSSSVYTRVNISACVDLLRLGGRKRNKVHIHSTETFYIKIKVDFALAKVVSGFEGPSLSAQRSSTSHLNLDAYHVFRLHSFVLVFPLCSSKSATKAAL